MNTSPGADVFARLQNQRQGLDFEAKLRQQARQSTAANRFGALAATSTRSVTRQTLARASSQTR
jgi:hypothetical protein